MMIVKNVRRMTQFCDCCLVALFYANILHLKLDATMVWLVREKNKAVKLTWIQWLDL